MRVGKSKIEETPRHASALINTIIANVSALATLAQALSPLLFNAKTIHQLITAIEAVNATEQRDAPGKLYAGVVSALELNGSSVPTIAMVTLAGATIASPCYIPPHIRSAITTSQDVWIMAVNGLKSDLIVFSIRNVF